MPTSSPIEQRSSDVIIAGAGIIGLSTAIELALHGLSVTVLEQGEAMREASWAAAGMLAAHDPENPPELRPLADLSLDLYPGYLATIERFSGLRVPFRTMRTLQGLHGGAQHSAALDRPELANRLPGLVAGGRSFLWLEEQSLDPRDLCRALPVAAAAAGVRLLEHTRVTRVEASPDGVRVYAMTSDDQVESTEQAWSVRSYLHCGGAWSGAPLFGGTALPVEPRKGQMLAVMLAQDAPSLDCVVRTPELYLVPRGEGRVIIGATVERAGFDRTVTDGATEALLAAAAELWPPIRQARVVERWSGLRPSAPDALPILDSLGESREAVGSSSHVARPRLWVATGHYRNGILLAPATAHVLRQMVLGEVPAIDLYPFRVARFAAVPA